jgi:hypothetical protein
VEERINPVVAFIGLIVGIKMAGCTTLVCLSLSFKFDEKRPDRCFVIIMAIVSLAVGMVVATKIASGLTLGWLNLGGRSLASA